MKRTFFYVMFLLAVGIFFVGTANANVFQKDLLGSVEGIDVYVNDDVNAVAVYQFNVTREQDVGTRFLFVVTLNSEIQMIVLASNLSPPAVETLIAYINKEFQSWQMQKRTTNPKAVALSKRHYWQIC